MKGIYLTLKDLYSIDEVDELKSEDINLRSGFNLGNFAFRLGLSRIVNIEDYVTHSFASVNEINQHLDNQFDRPTIISCANWLGNNEASELFNQKRYTSLKTLETKFVPFSIGVQNGNRHELFKLKKHSLSLISLLSERSEQISVRDYYTQNILEYNGIYNTRVTGCPSNFISYHRDLGSIIEKKCNSLLLEHDLDSLKHHICEYSQGHRFSQKVLLNTARFLSKNVSSYVIQSPDLLSFSMNENIQIPYHYQRAFRFRHKTLRQKVMHFTNTVSWMNYSRGFDLSWGMRLHGNILPMQAGVPSLIITHDSRTEGLADTMALPQMSIDQFIKYKPKEYSNVIVNSILEQVGLYDLKRQYLHNEFIEFIKVNKLEVNQGFAGMFDD
ncbi:polysaccharide pyruvyl transferase family protein [Vibrio cyclitrophicus]|uniref:polysaccharide pyruvyl transferase family protein n=1 Tax=Vibrio cyclitrophicus TaxID=47951 RepID=UPI00030E73DE|nr:polysaccharide pyruvyl transferase family protein [Vibrio cyclitrophicus]OCH48064.1 hypothetical protein A6D96_15060 [Vibrio cyclitrophicus]